MTTTDTALAETLATRPIADALRLLAATLDTDPTLDLAFRRPHTRRLVLHRVLTGADEFASVAAAMRRVQRLSLVDGASPLGLTFVRRPGSNYLRVMLDFGSEVALEAEIQVEDSHPRHVVPITDLPEWISQEIGE